MSFDLDRFKAAVKFGRTSSNPAIHDCSEMMGGAADELDRLRAIQKAAGALMQTAAYNSKILSERGHRSMAFQAAGDQWHAAYTELRAALKVAEDD